MKIKISWKYLIALLALMIVTGELHEQVHINTGRIICGGYGPRDFNVWSTAADCRQPALAFLATLAGPLWSYLVMWTGAVLLIRAKSPVFKAIGFSLVFAPLPFARIFTAVMGGGDERVFLRAVFNNQLDAATVKILAAILVTAICLPPILIAWRRLKNRFSILYIIGFCVMPLIVLGLYVLTFLNGLLAAGFLATPYLLGTPTLILAHFSLMAIILVITRKWLLEINQTPTESDKTAPQKTFPEIASFSNSGA